MLCRIREILARPRLSPAERLNLTSSSYAYTRYHR